jgi:hypothetical protein
MKNLFSDGDSNIGLGFETFLHGREVIRIHYPS